MDEGYLAFAILLGVFGIVGITATANVSPDILASPTCNCIPSPVARLQELSLVLLAFGAVLAPVGILRRSTGVGTMPKVQRVLPSGRTYTGPTMRNGGFFALGVSLVVLGIGLVAIPSFLVIGNRLLIIEGAGMVAFGAYLAYRGGRSG